MRSLSARWTKASRWTPAVEDSSRHPTCTKHQRFSCCSRHLNHQITRPIQHFLANHRVFEGAHPNLKLLKFGFRGVVLLHVLEWSHNSHILTLSPSVFSKKKHGYVFFSLFFPVVILSIFSSLTFFFHRFGVACWDRQDRDVNCNKSKASPEDDGQMSSRGV